MLKKVNLQLLAAPSAGDPGSGGNSPAATPPAASATPPASVNFTPDQLAEIDRITTERTTRASQAALNSYFLQQGKTEAQATEAMKAYKETTRPRNCHRVQLRRSQPRKSVLMMSSQLPI